nr:immunoglobulin heavy chain junction region [Macaca mulatta]MOV49574.1 immunoglobulin heavy chain junction region [Macaca mulatta]
CGRWAAANFDYW